MAGSARRDVAKAFWRSIPLVPFHSKVGFVHVGGMVVWWYGGRLDKAKLATAQQDSKEVEDRGNSTCTIIV
jgi:hypothetical protein